MSIKSTALSTAPKSLIAFDRALPCLALSASETVRLRKAGRTGLAFDRGSVRTYSADGFLHIARTHISKANICPYLGREIPDFKALGLDPDRIYQLFRDPEELAKAAPTFNNLKLLSEHVAVDVDDDHPELTIGSTGTDANFEAQFLDNSLVVHNKDAIAGIEDKSQQELSCAYRYRADMTPGNFGGMPFDGVMRDIVGNHVALVKAGRAGSDVVVGDSAATLMRHIDMKKTPKISSRKALMATGAVLTYLQPRMAQDQKIDVVLAFDGVTAANFKAKKPAIIASITDQTKGKLAQDADLSDLPALIDAFEDLKVAEGQDELEPKPLPQAAAPGKDEEDPAKAFLKTKLSAEDMKAFDDLCAKPKAADADETDEEKAARLKKEEEEDKKKPPAADANGLTPDKVVTPKAMDAALATQRKAIFAEQAAIREAEKDVRPYVGELAMAHDSAAAVYHTALGALGIEAAAVTDITALQQMLKAQPLAGTPAKRDPKLAQDAATAATEFAKMFPDAKPLVRS